MSREALVVLCLSGVFTVIVAWLFHVKGRRENALERRTDGEQSIRTWRAFISAEQNEGRLKQVRMTGDGELHTDVTIDVPVATASATASAPTVGDRRKPNWPHS